jgi:hypothetical protein
MDKISKGLLAILMLKVLTDLLFSFTITKLIMLFSSIAILSFCFFSLKRSEETREFLREGIKKSLEEIDTEDFKIDLKRFGRHTRYFIGAVSLASFTYWLGVKAYVSMALGLTGAILVFAEFVLNFEVVDFLTSDPAATFSDSGAAAVISTYKAISFVHMTTITVVILMLIRS